MSLVVLGEFLEPHEVLTAATTLRVRADVRLEAYVPYPVPGLDRVLAARPSRLPFAVMAAGLTGAASAYVGQWLVDAVLYPLDVGGRPPHFPLAFVPITFEMGVLAAGLAAFVGVLVRGRLLRLWQALFEVEGFASVTRDGFWLGLHAVGDHFDAVSAADELTRLGARRVRLLGVG